MHRPTSRREWLERELKGLDDEDDRDVNASTLIVGVVLLVAPTLILALAATFAVYFAF